MARLMKNPSHCPRWEKDKISGCAIPQCKDPFFSKCNIPNSDIVQCLTIAGENIPSKLDIAPPLCKHHYHVVYNVHKPTQTHCPACSTGLQKGSRPCPDAASITMYLADKTGYEGTIGENDKVCFSCYKSHLHILKHTQSESTDEELNELLKEIKHTIIKPEQIKSIEDAISMAMSMTTVYVGEALLQQEGLLLPDVHNFFLGVCPSISAKEQGVRVLSNLTTTLKLCVQNTEMWHTPIYTDQMGIFY